MPQVGKPKIGRSRPRLPWKRGPVAWEIACRAEEILDHLSTSSKSFFSLRRTAKILGISTQPLRDWVRLGYIAREGPRDQFAKADVRKLVSLFAERAEPFDPRLNLNRIYSVYRRPYPFDKLRSARLIWPRAVPVMSPAELARAIGCHPSTIIKAILKREVRGHRRTLYRWEIKRKRWDIAFPCTIVPKHQNCKIFQKTLDTTF